MDPYNNPCMTPIYTPTRVLVFTSHTPGPQYGPNTPDSIRDGPPKGQALSLRNPRKRSKENTAAKRCKSENRQVVGIQGLTWLKGYGAGVLLGGSADSVSPLSSKDSGAYNRGYWR